MRTVSVKQLNAYGENTAKIIGAEEDNIFCAVVDYAEHRREKNKRGEKKNIVPLDKFLENRGISIL